MNICNKHKQLGKRVKIKFYYSLVLFLVILFLSLIGCERSRPGSRKPAAPPKKVTLGLSATSMLPSLVHIAKNKGYFLDEGIDMEIRGYPTGKHALAATLKGEIDIGTVADTPIVFNSFVREDFSVFATILDSAKHVKVLARKDRNIIVPRDLTGKKIATTKRTTADFFMNSFFVYNKIDSSTVEVIDLKPKEMVSAIVNGDVDAIFAWEPMVTKAHNILGDIALIMSGEVGYMATFNLVSKNNFIENNPETIKNVLKALIKAEEFSRNNRDESIDIIASYLEVERETIDKLWDIYDFKVCLNQSLLLTLEEEARWAIKNKLSDKTETPNFIDFIYLDGMKTVKPEAVALIH